jgi:hypothetical protein
MVLADVSFGDLFWTSVWIFFLIMFIWLFIAIVSDLFRDHELSGWAKALWVVALIVLPLLGSLVYVIARGQGMAERSAAHAQRERAELDSYIRSTAASSGTGPVDDLTRLTELRNSGTITDAEFESMKARVVGATAATSGGTAPTSGGTAPMS